MASDFYALGEDMRAALSECGRPNRLPPGARGNADVIQHSQTIHQGPLPRPEDFEAYDRVLRGAADRVLRMEEKQAAHRQELEKPRPQRRSHQGNVGTILAYITFGGSMFGAVYLLLHDKPIQSLAALIVALGSAFGPKIYADFI